MEAKHWRMIIGGLVGAGVFAVLVNFATQITVQNNNERQERENLAEWRRQLDANRIRTVERQLHHVEWELQLLKSDVAGINTPLAQPQVTPGVSPEHSSKAVEEKIEYPRHYFQKCQGKNFIKVKKGMTRNEVRTLAKGKEYPPFETSHNGFVFALNDDRSSFYVFPGWMPINGMQYDFFVFEDKLLLYVRYDLKQGKAEDVRVSPLTIHNQLSPQQAGVEIRQVDDKTLQMTVRPE